MKRGLARSRSEAQALVRAGRVEVEGASLPKPATTVTATTPITVDPGHRRWVSRAGAKLDFALDRFEIDVEGRRTLDIGASTGGFTEVLLSRGAAEVVALDVGTRQLDPSLLDSDRVRSIEQTNVRGVDLAALGAPFDVVVADLSFISLCTVAGEIAGASGPDAEVILLVKPQFEVGKQALGRRGVVSDESVRRGALRRVADCMASVGLGARDWAHSPITGREGNVEYLLWLRNDEPSIDLEALS